MSEELRMAAYWYEFKKTGSIEIDRILSAVAIAGEAHHNTAAWADEDSNYGNGSLIDLIQASADSASKRLSHLSAVNEKLVEALKEISNLPDKDSDMACVIADRVLADEMGEKV